MTNIIYNVDDKNTEQNVFLIIHSCTALWSCCSSFKSIKFYVSKTKINTASGKYSKGKCYTISYIPNRINAHLI